MQPQTPSSVAQEQRTRPDGAPGDSSSTSPSPARRAADEAVREAKAAAHDLGTAAKREATQAAQDVRRRGEQMLSRQKQCYAEDASHFEHAFQAAARTLREEGEPRVAEYTELVAEQMGRCRSYLEDSSVRELYDDAQCFTRKHPELVLGGLLIGGLVVARFLRASAAQTPQTQSEEGENIVGPIASPPPIPSSRPGTPGKPGTPGMTRPMPGSPGSPPQPYDAPASGGFRP